MDEVHNFVIPSRLDNERVGEPRDKVESVVVDVKVYVNWETYLSVKYQVSTVAQVHRHSELNTIVSQWIAASEVERRLRDQNQIVTDLTDAMIAEIKSSKSYVEYTNESGTVVLSLEKLFQVCYRVFQDFKLGKHDYTTVVSYRWEGKLIERQTIQELINFVTGLYAQKNQKMVIEGGNQLYNKLTFDLLVKRYGRDLIPMNMNFFKLRYEEYYEMFEVPDQYMHTLAIEKVVAALTDNDNKKIEFDQEGKDIHRVDVTVNTNNLHERDRVISKSLLITPETESLVDTLVKTQTIQKEVRVTMFEYLSAVGLETDIKVKNESLRKDFSVINMGWLTAPKQPKNDSDRAQVTFSELFLDELRKDYFMYIYCPLNYEFLRIKHPAGIKVDRVEYLQSFFRMLSKFFHLMHHLTQIFYKDPGKVDVLRKAIMSQVPKAFGKTVAVQQRIGIILQLNMSVWARKIVVEEFGDIKGSYLPSIIIGGEVPSDPVEEGGLVFDF